MESGANGGRAGAGDADARGRSILVAGSIVLVAALVLATLGGIAVADAPTGGPSTVDAGQFQTGPTADLTATPNPASPGESVELDARASTAPDGDDIVACEFDLNGDGVYDRTTQTCLTTVTYETAGERSVTVRVRTDANQTDTASISLSVATNEPPRAVVDVEPDVPRPGETVTLSAASSTDPDGAIVEYLWEVDGRGLTGETVSMAFETADEYEVSLLVRDDDGAESRTATTVEVRAAQPRAALAVSPAEPAVGETVTLDASGSSHPDGAIASYRWDLDGDGEPDRTTSGPQVTVAFDEPGTVAIGVTVVDERGNTDSAGAQLSVGTSAGETTAFPQSGSDGDGSDGAGTDLDPAPAGQSGPLDLGLVPLLPDALAAFLLLVLLGGAGVAMRRREAVAGRADRLRDLLTRGDVRRRIAKKLSGTTVKNVAKRTVRRLSDLIEAGGEGVGEGVERSGRAIKRGSHRFAEWLRRVGG